MKVDIKWVALLDEDQDDFLIIQQGINAWATDIALRWFKNFSQFENTLVTETSLPSLIVLNGIAPSGTELEWVRQFKLRPASIDIPIIIMVEDYWEEQKKHYNALGIYDYITKPVSGNELKTLIDKIRAVVSVT